MSTATTCNIYRYTDIQRPNNKTPQNQKTIPPYHQKHPPFLNLINKFLKAAVILELQFPAQPVTLRLHSAGR